MLQIVGSFSYKHGYDINSQKSACLVFNNKRNSDKIKLMLNNDPIPVSDSTTHLGLKRDLGECTHIERKIELGRRTAYSLLGAGFHGFNGLKQDNKAHIWNTFVVPRILYGLEVSMISQIGVKKLDKFKTNV